MVDYMSTLRTIVTKLITTMSDWHVFSTDDMVNWHDHGAFFGIEDIPWAEMAWAPDCVERDGKYFFYYPVERKKIGVAVSDNPTSGFVDSGKPLIELKEDESNIKVVGREPIDPSIYIHEGQAYMFFGCRDFRYVKLKDNMTKLDGKVQEVKIIGNEGDEQNFGGYYGEVHLSSREAIYTICSTLMDGVRPALWSMLQHRIRLDHIHSKGRLFHT